MKTPRQEHNRDTIFAAIALQSYLRFRPIDPNLNLIPRRDRPCQMERRSQLITAAGRNLKCDAKADVITAVPMVNNRTAERSYAAQLVCLDHSVQFAVWKLIERINAAQKERRIVTL